MFCIKGNIGSIYRKKANCDSGIAFYIDSEANVVVSVEGHSVPVHNLKFLSEKERDSVKRELDHIFSSIEEAKDIDFTKMDL